MGASLPFIKPFYMTDDNFLAAGYQLFLYEVGTTDPKASYQDFDLTIPNTHPIILDATGHFNCFTVGGPYKAVLKTPVADGSATVWTEPKFSGVGSDSLLVVPNVAALKALTPNAASQILVLGYYTPGDGGGGVVLWNSGTSLSDDGVYFKPTILLLTDPGRWVRSFVGAVNLLFYGAKGDGATSDSTALDKAIAYCIATPGNTIEITPSPTQDSYKFSVAVTGLDAQGFTLKVQDGSRLDFDILQAIGCTFDAGPYQIFNDSSAQVTFNSTARLEQGAYPEWWGAIGNGVFDSEIALNKCFLSTAAMYVLPSPFYLVVGAVGFPPTGTIYSYGKIQDSFLVVQLGVGIFIFTPAGIVQAEYIRGELVTSGLAVQSDTDVTAGILPTGGSNKARAGISLTTFPKGIGRLGIDLTGYTKINGPHDFASIPIEKNTLNQNGDTLVIDTAGTVSDDANTKQIDLWFGGVQVFASGTFKSYVDVGADIKITHWHLQAKLIRTAVGSVYVNAMLSLYGIASFNTTAPGGATVFRPNIIKSASVAVDLTVADTVVKMVGTATGGATINQGVMTANFEPNN